MTERKTREEWERLDREEEFKRRVAEQERQVAEYKKPWCDKCRHPLWGIRENGNSGYVEITQEIPMGPVEPDYATLGSWKFCGKCLAVVILKIKKALE